MVRFCFISCYLHGTKQLIDEGTKNFNEQQTQIIVHE